MLNKKNIMMRKLVAIAFLFALIISACDEDTTPEDALQDYPVDIQGTWTLDKVFRNNVDITNKISFNDFELTLNYEGEQPSTFTISNGNTPFACVNPPEVYFTEGAWAFDDLTYPTEVHFTQDATTVEVTLDQPLYNEGNQTLLLKINIGCDENEYIYQFAKNQ